MGATAWTAGWMPSTALPAVAEDLVVLQAADGMFHAGADLAVGGIIVLLARK